MISGVDTVMSVSIVNVVSIVKNVSIASIVNVVSCNENKNVGGKHR